MSTKDYSEKFTPPTSTTSSGPAELIIPNGSKENLKRALNSRQLSMIAIGGTIGTGLFLASLYFMLLTRFN